ncbi:MAG: hypothetical protein RR942_13730 [Romboutsia sp.]
MIKVSQRFMQLIVERHLDVEQFSQIFYNTYGYFVDFSIICNDYIELLEIGVCKDLCEFFNVSFNYFLGLSSKRSPFIKVNPCDETLALANVFFNSENYSPSQKKELYMSICKIFNKIN